MFGKTPSALRTWLQPHLPRELDQFSVLSIRPFSKEFVIAELQLLQGYEETLFKVGLGWRTFGVIAFITQTQKYPASYQKLILQKTEELARTDPVLVQYVTREEKERIFLQLKVNMILPPSFISAVQEGTLSPERMSAFLDNFDMVLNRLAMSTSLLENYIIEWKSVAMLIN